MSDQPQKWMLPTGIDEILPGPARQLEGLRRRLLDLFSTWGYDLVVPPLLEYLDALLVGAGEDLDLQTFKVVDQLDGRLLGLRADMTPQVARIDAHRLRSASPTRLCYLGSVVRTTDDGFGGSRSPIQLGAELYGFPGPRGDAEIISLMLAVLRAAGVRTIHLDLGHMGIFHALLAEAGLNAHAQGKLFAALQRKAVPEIESLLAAAEMPSVVRRALRELAELHGDATVLARAKALFENDLPVAGAALDELIAIVAALPNLECVEICFDLAELRGFRYQTGVVFAAYVPGRGQELARGGRYDDIGEVFGRARAATGFSTDLKGLLEVGDYAAEAVTSGVATVWPASDDHWAAVNALREQGERVVFIDDHPAAAGQALGCDRVLEFGATEWQVVILDTARTASN